MLQEFDVKTLKETLENEKNLFQIMDHRLSYFSKNENKTNNKNKFLDILKIPDICYLVKETQSNKIFNILTKNKKVTKSGHYHYIYGLNTSSVALISAYISKYIQKKHHQTNYKIIHSYFINI